MGLQKKSYKPGAKIGRYIPEKDAGDYLGQYIYNICLGDGTVLASETTLEHAKSTAKNYTFKGETVFIYKCVGVMIPTARWY